jgi:hypothetical protein
MLAQVDSLNEVEIGRRGRHYNTQQYGACRGAWPNTSV